MAEKYTETAPASGGVFPMPDTQLNAAANENDANALASGASSGWSEVAPEFPYDLKNMFPRMPESSNADADNLGKDDKLS